MAGDQKLNKCPGKLIFCHSPYIINNSVFPGYWTTAPQEIPKLNSGAAKFNPQQKSKLY